VITFFVGGLLRFAADEVRRAVLALVYRAADRRTEHRYRRGGF
jgi:hypothetical protein